MKFREIRRYVKAGAALAIMAYVFHEIVLAPAKIEAAPYYGDLVAAYLTREEDLNTDQKAIFEELKTRLGELRIGPLGKALYTITYNRENEPVLLTIAGPDFNRMTEEEINEYVARALAKLIYGA